MCFKSPCDAAHIRIGFNGTGIKPPDDRVLPLCREHHTKQHNIGEKIFWSELDIDPLDLAKKIYNSNFIDASVVIKSYRIKIFL